MKTVLNNREVWFDGSVSVKPTQVLDYVSKVPSGKLHVTKLNDDVIGYNNMVASKEELNVKSELGILDRKWNLPQEYNEINVFQYIIDKFEKTAIQDELSDSEFDERLTRVSTEYKHFKKKKLIPLLRTLIYVINTFERKKIVWGPGRGSSVSSYMLYVLGVHDVDSVLFGLNITDFLRDIE